MRLSVVERSYAEIAADALRLLGPTYSDKGDAAEAKKKTPAKKSKAAGAEEEDLAALSRRELQARAGRRRACEPQVRGDYPPDSGAAIQHPYGG